VTRGSSGGSISSAPGAASGESVAVQGSQVVVQATSIAAGASITAAIDLGTARLARIAMPAAWDAADLTFRTSFDGVAFADLYDIYGSEYTVKAAASRSIIVPLSDFVGVRYLEIRSGKSSLAVNQTALRALTLVLVP
jgi:hypothetical protein